MADCAAAGQGCSTHHGPAVLGLLITAYDGGPRARYASTVTYRLETGSVSPGDELWIGAPVLSLTVTTFGYTSVSKPLETPSNHFGHAMPVASSQPNVKTRKSMEGQFMLHKSMSATTTQSSHCRPPDMDLPSIKWPVRNFIHPCHPRADERTTRDYRRRLLSNGLMKAIVQEAKLLETNVNPRSLELLLDTGRTGMAIWKFVAAPKPGVLAACYPGLFEQVCAVERILFEALQRAIMAASTSRSNQNPKMQRNMAREHPSCLHLKAWKHAEGRSKSDLSAMSPEINQVDGGVCGKMIGAVLPSCWSGHASSGGARASMSLGRCEYRDYSCAMALKRYRSTNQSCLAPEPPVATAYQALPGEGFSVSRSSRSMSWTGRSLCVAWSRLVRSDVGHATCLAVVWLEEESSQGVELWQKQVSQSSDVRARRLGSNPGWKGCR
ncbi:uncharacterized protein CLUP02_17699 [Colletotrichum lupini]|uniref:Uncharacterized protein n=1 Tax=Colletotrichum lupini TaxID=145971 RepID=A0A9Q8SF14_9PEZI|nr:uncharacterized protein CLUP02_17699 [Colletotrichum lupini]UQC76186.1 hypothetical protein CLUP02_17699 [Colletotrichum lupini]